ncbi:hypothetical protein PMAYCL1PPCAC_14780, partial [Pristionchus mayeri]
LLKLHLAVSDVMILLLKALPDMLWILTYEWKGTDAMCKTFKFLSIASFYLSSNIVVCIAIDRLRNVLGAKRIRPDTGVRHLLMRSKVAWLFALVWSFPQLVVFQTIDVLQNPAAPWIQCTDVWSIHR